MNAQSIISSFATLNENNEVVSFNFADFDILVSELITERVGGQLHHCGHHYRKRHHQNGRGHGGGKPGRYADAHAGTHGGTHAGTHGGTHAGTGGNREPRWGNGGPGQLSAAAAERSTFSALQIRACPKRQGG